MNNLIEKSIEKSKGKKALKPKIENSVTGPKKSKL
jgi:hypothetical protein